MSTNFKCIRCGQPATATDVRKSDGFCDSCDPGPDFACADLEAAVEAHASAPLLAELPVKPIDMVLHCPACGMQHIDAPKPCDMGMGCEQAGVCYASAVGQPERCTAWDNPPHRSHLCHGCGHIWRPADVPTNGVQAVKTRGKNDSA